MAFVYYDYYLESYLQGREEALSNTLFSYWEKQAEQEMNKLTLGRTARISEDDVTEEIKDCACELAELLYQANEVQQSGISAGGSGPLASYSNDGESGTYDLTQSDYTSEGVSRKTRQIINKYLLTTGLLYAGVKR